MQASAGKPSVKLLCHNDTEPKLCHNDPEPKLNILLAPLLQEEACHRAIAAKALDQAMRALAGKPFLGCKHIIRIVKQARCLLSI